jgi:hypothetical protein
MFARLQAQRKVVTMARRSFGADASHNPSRMQFDEWKALNIKLQQPTLQPQEKSTIVARFTEARLSEYDVSNFHQRLKVQQMSEEQYQAYYKDVSTNIFSRTHPKTTAYNLEVIAADRANTPRPDMFEIKPLNEDMLTFKNDLGKGNLAQKIVNEHIYKMQNDPVLCNKRLGGYGLEHLNIQTTQKQSLILFWASLPFAFYGAKLYRDLYMEKYSLYDMLNWETRVVCARAQKERGW